MGQGLGPALRERILEERAPDGIRAGAGEGPAASAMRKAQSTRRTSLSVPRGACAPHGPGRSGHSLDQIAGISAPPRKRSR